MEQTQKQTAKPYSPGFREPAVRLALTAIAGKLGCAPDSLRVWVRQVQRDGGDRPGQTSAEKARIKELERENRELLQVEPWERHWSERPWRGEVLKKGEPLSAIGPRAMSSAYFAQVLQAARHRFSAACSGSTARFANH